jgi:DNA-binding MarR family transcriptional regulator
MIPALPAGCWDLDLATGMLALCSQSRMMFGLSPASTDRLAESEWSNRFHPEDLVTVRNALTAGLVNGTPYAVRFRTIHPSGTIQVVLGVGRPLKHANNNNAHFVGWNFDVASTGATAAEWISTQPDVLSAEHLLSVLPSSVEPENGSSNELPSEALLERAKSVLRVRRARERLFCRAMFGEPAFELLLYLYVQSGQKGISLTSLTKPARIPYSSAIRWIRYLADKGLVECAESRSDRRATTIQLTPSGRAVMDEFLSLQ